MQYILTENNDRKVQYMCVKKQIFGFGISGENIDQIDKNFLNEFYLLHIHRENLIPEFLYLLLKNTILDIFIFPEVKFLFTKFIECSFIIEVRKRMGRSNHSFRFWRCKYESPSCTVLLLKF